MNTLFKRELQPPSYTVFPRLYKDSPSSNHLTRARYTNLEINHSDSIGKSASHFFQGTYTNILEIFVSLHLKQSSYKIISYGHH